MKRICKQCGKEFELSESEIGFYKGRGLELPKRCKACREQNKEQGKGQKQQQTQRPVSNPIGNDKDSRDHKNGTDKSRYIISAAAVLFIVFAFLIKGIFAVPAEEPTLTEDVASPNVQARQETQAQLPGELPKEAPTTQSQGNEEQQEVQQSILPTAVTPQETEAAAEGTTHPPAAVQEVQEIQEPVADLEPAATGYVFRKPEYLTEHFQKHGAEFPYATQEEYLLGANNVIQNPNALHKLEAEDGDDVYYVESTREFVVVSTDGYIRTYFLTDLDYYNRQ